MSFEKIMHRNKNCIILHEMCKDILLPQNISDSVTYGSYYNTYIASGIYTNIACTDPANHYFRVKPRDNSLQFTVTLIIVCRQNQADLLLHYQ
jgi:hypothetical protein